MTQVDPSTVKLTRNFTTKSGKPITLGTGTGTKWQWSKKSRSEDVRDSIHQDLVDQLLLALKADFNHLDTAEFYSTQPEIGAAIKQSNIPREDIFVTTKYNPGFGDNYALTNGPSESIDIALKQIDTDYIDLFLIHSPFFTEPAAKGQTLESAWKEIVQAKKKGKVRHIGVSNFTVDHLKTIFASVDSKGEYPEVNQIEFHPYLQDQTAGISKFSRDHDIQLEAYAPLSAISRVEKDGESIDHPLKTLLPKLEEKYGKTLGQILLRYTLQKDYIPITTSANEERIKQAIDVYNFELKDEDVALIDSEGAKYHHRGFFDELYTKFGL